MELRLGTPEDAGMLTEKKEYYERLVASWIDKGFTQAYSMLVARKGIIVSHKAYGKLKADLDSPPAEIDTIFPLASMSKPITATAAMILVERGLLSLSFPVAYYIPEFTGENKDKVLVRHLLTHTSGLRDADIYENASKKKETVVIPPHHSTQHPGIHERLFLGYDTPLWKMPGTEMSYSSYGIELIGEIIRRISGLSLNDFCRKEIFEPLGMKDTHFIVPESLYSRVVARPENLPMGKWFTSQEALQKPSAAGGAYSTVLDMAKLGQMFLNKGRYGMKRILCEASVREMTRNQIPGISSTYGEEYFVEASYGYSWSINGEKKDNYDLFSPQAYNHGGAGGVMISIDPTYQLITVLFSAGNKINDGKSLWYPERYLFNNAVIAAIDEI
jgi:CubicO group peptidase (beta-lactamase class C family)